MFQYRKALVRNLADNFINALTGQHDVQIDFALAKQQHALYVDCLKSLVSEVITLEADQNHPDCCFIEDTAEVISNQVIINQIGASSRHGEEKPVATFFENTDMTVHYLTGNARADGGDILNLGHSVLVGVTKRTNLDAVKQIESFLKPVPVIPIYLDQGLHLKSFITQMDRDCILISNCKQGQKIGEQLGEKTGSDFRLVFVPDQIASNCLRINNTLVIQAGFEKSARAIRAYAEDMNLATVQLEMSEFIKADGALTCCSILIL